MRTFVGEKLICFVNCVSILVSISYTFLAKAQEKKAKPITQEIERAGWELGKIAPAVSNMAKVQDTVDVIVNFKGKFLPQVREKSEKKYLLKIEELRSKIEAILQKANECKPWKAKPNIEQHELEAEYLRRIEKELSEDDRTQLKALREQLDAETKKMRKSLFEEVKKANESRLNLFENVINELGGKVKAKILTQNALGIIIPSCSIKKLAEHDDVIEITLDVKAEPE